MKIKKIILPSHNRSNSRSEFTITKYILPNSNRSNSPLDFVIDRNVLSKSKRSQSQVIGTVLLILLVIATITIISAFAIPFVKEQLSNSDCFKLVGKMEIKNNMQYTCYNSSATPKEMLVQVYIADIVDKISGFSIEIGGASSKNFEITSDYSSPEVSMYTPGGVEIPGKNEERTYVINNIQELPQSISLYAILKNGKTCDEPAYSVNSVENCFIL